jgi:hypothetical protein
VPLRLFVTRQFTLQSDCSLKRLCIREKGNVLKLEFEKIGRTGLFQCCLNRKIPQILSCIYFCFVAEISFSLCVNILLGGHASRNPLFFLTRLMSPKCGICCGIDHMNPHCMSLLRRLSFWVSCLKLILANADIR